MTAVTFIVPVRHQDNARDWGLLKRNLAQTVTSIANQTNPDWRGIVVANDGADLPVMPDKFSVVRVSFPPNDIHERGDATENDFLDSFRADKGRRVLAGMLNAAGSRFFMIVDDDDLVSSRIVQYASKHPNENGWRIDKGYRWDDGGNVLLCRDQFSHYCGTSLIIRSDLYGLPAKIEDAPIEWIKDTLGSHVRIAPALAKRGTPLNCLPFRAAVYRVAHQGSHNKTPSLMQMYFVSRSALKRPFRVARNLAGLRLLSARHRKEFFGRPE
ncbi:MULTISPECIES: galactosyl transferase [Mesorhizobium]|uniref:galactosyl transferase n=1 Tax=Mesorhizobium TaxID=68287 RepID=UPI0007ECA79C|nr:MULTISPECIES: galactosyl transferase [Mesorhizobium]TPJ38323.1 galactosyl transferase [Mesorhizobium sp. B2-6-6]ARP67150.1 galactosyl transferase [Mesorhizobium sp. WSM1497]MCA0002726.1 galactosyl transferase [Mesorhizobium sp. B264B2A]MCA0009123.1 galactosyl transferase [Mesorhizobium sp. B264B1B]MCA0014480.1 galactosyl transferase [Mesorhizobium sp. B294B1A1]